MVSACRVETAIVVSRVLVTLMIRSRVATRISERGGESEGDVCSGGVTYLRGLVFVGEEEVGERPGKVGNAYWSLLNVG